MGVEKYRSISEMPPPWHDPDEPGNLRRVAVMLAVYRQLAPKPEPGVHRFRSAAEVDAEREYPYRPAETAPGHR